MALDAKRSLGTNPRVVATTQAPTVSSDRTSAVQRGQSTTIPTATARAKAVLANNETQPIGFTGYLKDPESGLYYAKARYYDPQIGRFTTQDPVEGIPMQPPSLHRYLYAYANPTTYTDPTGRCSDPLCAWGLGMAYAHDDEERAAVTRATINTSPAFGRSAGAFYEAGMQFAGPAQMGVDTVAAMQATLRRSSAGEIASRSSRILVNGCKAHNAPMAR
jgi:RHS repeat-associated protein